MMALWFLVVCSLTLVAAQGQFNNVSYCYSCDSSENGSNCLDPYNKEIGGDVLCSEFDGDDKPARSASRSHPFSSGFIHERNSRSSDRSYKCVKIVAEKEGGGRFLMRTCGPVVTTVATTCEHMKLNIHEGYVMKSCYECDLDKCNGSSSLIAGIFSVVMAAFLISLH